MKTKNRYSLTEVIRRKNLWRGLQDVEFATLEWVDWFNNWRCLGRIGYTPPPHAMVAGLK